MTFDEASVLKAVRLVREPFKVFEVRALSARLKGQRFEGTVFGYFNSSAALISELSKLESFVGVYITLNPVEGALLARAKNRLKYARKGDATTSDNDIEYRRFLLIDIDAVRPSGVSATDLEKESARQKARAIFAFLKQRNWPAPLVADSGNGTHLLYRVDLPRDDEKVLEHVLAGLAEHFDGNGAKLDRTVHNPARIVRLYGTSAAKGDHITERPHRLSKVLDAPQAFENVTLDQLRALVKELQPLQAKPTRTLALRDKPSKEQIREMLAVIPGKPGYDEWLHFVSAVGDALPDSDAIEVLQERWPEVKQGEYADKLKHRLEDVHVATLIHFAQQHGWQPPELASVGLWTGRHSPPSAGKNELLPLPPAPYQPPPLTLLPTV
ncbi:MAG TPA: hypothetical protein VLQ29_00195, partial [Candidatus Dormibacteraeota bacterium]|nr:hypothetical protein [Candidatus Dormibacteraeota bacterium]